MCCYTDTSDTCRRRSYDCYRSSQCWLTCIRSHICSYILIVIIMLCFCYCKWFINSSIHNLKGNASLITYVSRRVITTTKTNHVNWHCIVRHLTFHVEFRVTRYRVTIHVQLANMRWILCNKSMVKLSSAWLRAT